MEKKPRAGVCRFCGCRESRACVDDAGPCWWVGVGRTLCSHCACVTLAQRQRLIDILNLVGRRVTHRKLYSWTNLERARALLWASAVYLRAGDNLVRVPTMPPHVARLKEIR
jgi:hypothetical protein